MFHWLCESCYSDDNITLFYIILVRLKGSLVYFEKTRNMKIMLNGKDNDMLEIF